MHKVYLKPGKEDSLKRFHPWIFSGAIARFDGEPDEGEVVEVYTSKKEFIAEGHFQIGSIAVRVLSFHQEPIDHGFWKRKLEIAYDMRRSIGIATNPTNNTYRLVHGEGDNLPGLVIDVYAKTAVMQAHSAVNGIEFELNSILVEKWKGKAYRLVIQRQKRMDGVLDLWEGEYTYRCILTNDYESSTREIVEFYNLRGGKERIFDDMNNGFGWDRLPKSFMAENTVFLLLTALIRNFYKAIIHRLDVKRFGLNATSRIKAFVFRFVSVPAKWIRTSRRYVLNIYTCNNAYADIFQTDFG